MGIPTKDELLGIVTREAQATPATVTAPGTAACHDVLLPNMNEGSVGTVHQYRGTVHGIGLTGQLSPGVFLIVAPINSAGAVEAAMAAMPAGGPPAGLAAVWWTRFGAAPYGSAPHALRAPLSIIGPGEVLRFETPLDGVAFAAIRLWVGRSSNDGGVPHNAWTATAQLIGVYTAPVARVFTAPALASALQPVRVPWVSAVTDYDVALAPFTAPYDDATGVFAVPPHVWCVGCNRMTLQFSMPSNRRLLAADGDYTYDLLWYMHGGRWSRRPTDHLTATARGAVNYLHDYEDFDIPAGAQGIYLRRLTSHASGAGPTISVSLV